MNSRTLQFQFEGPEAEREAQCINYVVATAFPGYDFHTTAIKLPSHGAQTRDVVTTTLSIIAAPSAIDDALSLADRLKRKEMALRLVSCAKERRGRRLDDLVVVLPPHGLKLPIDQAKPEQLGEALGGANLADQEHRL